MLRATGLKPPTKHAPKALRSTEDLRTFQRLMLHAVIRPLAKNDGLQKTWIDGRPMAEVAAEFIKPNDRLTAFERLQIYNRCYWFRLIDCVYDDCPGLHALLGDKKFAKLVEAFLAKYPSRSFSLRNLCSRMEQFLREEPRWTAPHTALAREIARFEWAQTVAFDGESLSKITPDDIADAPPARLRLTLQPYITLLALNYPLDDYFVAVKKRNAVRADASNAPDGAHAAVTSKRLPRPRRQRTYVAVHRVDELLYYKRLEAPAFKILEALRDGRPLARAVAVAGRGVTPELVQRWFATWMELGWFSRRK
jgi:hypothetical protein